MPTTPTAQNSVPRSFLLSFNLDTRYVKSIPIGRNLNLETPHWSYSVENHISLATHLNQ
jgi:hypothetical protein